MNEYEPDPLNDISYVGACPPHEHEYDSRARACESAMVDVAYVLKQLRTIRSSNCTSIALIEDCTQRAIDRMVRIQETLTRPE